MSPLRTTSNLQNLRKCMFCIFPALIGGSPDFLRMFQTIYTFIQWGLECVWRYTTYNFAYFYIFLDLIDGLQRFFHRNFSIEETRVHLAVYHIELNVFLYFSGVDQWFTKIFAENIRHFIHQGAECIWRYTTNNFA